VGILEALPFMMTVLIFVKVGFYPGQHNERHIRHPHHLQPQNSHLLLIILVQLTWLKNPDQIFLF